jgi:hypothetical protein
MDKISDKEVLYGTKSQSVYGKWKNRRRKVVREQKAKPGRHLIFLYKKKCGNNCSIIWMIVFVNKLWLDKIRVIVVVFLACNVL